MNQDTTPTEPNIPLNETPASERDTLSPVASLVPETDGRYEQWLSLYHYCQPLSPAALDALIVLLRGLHDLNSHEMLVPFRVAYRSARRMRAGRRVYGGWNPEKDKRDYGAESHAEVDDLANWIEMDRIRRELYGR